MNILAVFLYFSLESFSPLPASTPFVFKLTIEKGERRSGETKTKKREMWDVMEKW
jgi:hypothetical protein